MPSVPFYFLNIRKPKGITSFDVIFKLRRILKIKKIGHSGTLDPMASGVMQVAIGAATRLLEYLPSDKEYVAKIKFGYTSSTLDAEGKITKCEFSDFTKEDLKNVLKEFTGKIKQIPPIYSAIKVNGQKLCDIARKNPDAEVEIKSREVEIYKLELLNFNNDEAEIKVSCSKGTYIRTLAEDIAKKLKTHAYLVELTRTKAGNFKIEDSVEIEDTINCAKIPARDVLNLEEYILSFEEYSSVKNGVSIAPKTIPNSEILSLIYDNKLVSIGVFIDNKIKVNKFFNLN